MIERKDMVIFIKQQLGYLKGTTLPFKSPTEKGENVHYGKQELRQLLDVIYNGFPEKFEEYL